MLKYLSSLFTAQPNNNLPTRIEITNSASASYGGINTSTLLSQNILSNNSEFIGQLSILCSREHFLSLAFSYFPTNSNAMPLHLNIAKDKEGVVVYCQNHKIWQSSVIIKSDHTISLLKETVESFNKHFEAAHLNSKTAIYRAKEYLQSLAMIPRQILLTKKISDSVLIKINEVLETESLILKNLAEENKEPTNRYNR